MESSSMELEQKQKQGQDQERQEGTESRDPKEPKEESTEGQVKVITLWEDLDLDPLLLRSIFSYGFERPSPIQCKAIWPILQGRDLIAQSQSGSGKTASFVIGALQRICGVLVEKEKETTATAAAATADRKHKSSFAGKSMAATVAIILAPTHELAFQISAVAKGLSAMIPGLTIQTIVGGSSIMEDAQEMRRHPPHLVIGTPGRVCDMIRRRHLPTHGIQLAILDEADEMLSRGFQEQVHQIVHHLRSQTQIVLFSATMPDAFYAVTTQFMVNPLLISVKPEQLTLDGLKQYYVALENDRHKYMTLKNLYAQISVSQCIIYANSVKRVVELYDEMRRDQFPVCCIHSNMDKQTRQQVFHEFRTGVYRVLLSTDITSRGIDIQQVGIVINFDLCKDIHNYLHRIGRSGRYQKRGLAINFIVRRDIPIMRALEDHYHIQIGELPATFSV